MGFTGDSVDTS